MKKLFAQYVDIVLVLNLGRVTHLRMRPALRVASNLIIMMQQGVMRRDYLVLEATA